MNEFLERIDDNFKKLANDIFFAVTEQSNEIQQIRPDFSKELATGISMLLVYGMLNEKAEEKEKYEIIRLNVKEGDQIGLEDIKEHP